MPFSCHSWSSFFLEIPVIFIHTFYVYLFFPWYWGKKKIAKFLVGGKKIIMLVVPLKFMGVPPPGGKFKWNSPN